MYTLLWYIKITKRKTITKYLYLSSLISHIPLSEHHAISSQTWDPFCANAPRFSQFLVFLDITKCLLCEAEIYPPADTLNFSSTLRLQAFILPIQSLPSPPDLLFWFWELRFSSNPHSNQLSVLFVSKVYHFNHSTYSANICRLWEYCSKPKSLLLWLLPFCKFPWQILKLPCPSDACYWQFLNLKLIQLSDFTGTTQGHLYTRSWNFHIIDLCLYIFVVSNFI